MKTLNVNWMRILVLGAVMALFQRCHNTDEPMGAGDVEFQITDAPSDDASIKSVIVTVADVKVDGKSVSGFTKQTIDLKAYHEGSTKLLGTGHLDAKTYSNLTLVLDVDHDVNGATPGCYVLTTANEQYKLRNSGTINILLNKNWNVVANAASTVVIDFDLRKTIRSMTDISVRYNFVSDNDLSAAIRVVNQSKTGSISGSYSDQSNVSGDKVIVYAYKKGSFNATTETQAAGDSGIMFAHAEANAEVKQGLTGKTFKLVFLEAGDYELHFATYNKDAGSNRFVFQSMLKSQASGSATEFITIQSGITLSVSSVITGI